MSNSPRSRGFLTALMLSLSAACYASTTFTFDASIALDPTKLTANQNGFSYLQYFTGNAPFTLRGGDTITGTITFSNGSLSVQNAPGNQFWLDFDFFPTSGYAGTNFGSTVTVLGLTGTLGSTNPTPTSSGALGNGVVGADLPFSGSARNFLFTGINYTINVQSVTDISNNPAAVPFAFSRIDVQAQNISVNITQTPEPSTFALFGLGGAILVALQRTRRA